MGALARPSGTRGAEVRPIAPSKLAARIDEVLTASLADRASASAKETPSARALPVDVEALDRGFMMVRERFETLEGRAGDPAVLVGNRDDARGRVVLLDETPLAAPELAVLGAELVADGAASALVIAQIEGHEQGAEERARRAGAGAGGFAGEAGRGARAAPGAAAGDRRGLGADDERRGGARGGAGGAARARGRSAARHALRGERGRGAGDRRGGGGAAHRSGAARAR